MDNDNSDSENIKLDSGAKNDTRRQFVLKLARTTALPIIVPLSLSMSTAALA